MYVFKKTEANLWTVGFYEPNGAWIAYKDFDLEEQAAVAVHYLNGGSVETEQKSVLRPDTIFG